MALSNPGGATSPTPAGSVPGPALIGPISPPVSGEGALPPGSVVFDPTPHINAVENELKDWLNKPTRDILDQLNINPERATEERSGAEAAEFGSAGGGDMVAGLMSPMLEMLGTLGTGIFQGLNPQQMFEPVTQAFQQGAQSLQGIMGQMGQGGGWAGAGAAGTAAKTAATLGNGAAVSAQGSALGGQGAVAGADAAQGYTRLLELIIETQHRLEGLAAGVPWTAPEMGRTAGESTARAIEIVTELEAALTAQAAEMTATGAPVAVTEAPTQMMSMMGPMLQMAMSLMGPGIQMATMPLTMGSQLLSQGVQAGTQAATSMAQALGKGGAGAGGAKGLSSTSLAGTGAGAAMPKGAGGAGTGGGGAGTVAARALPTAMPTNLAGASESGSATPGAGARGVGGAGMAGGGMMGGAPMAGAGARGAGVGSGDHSAASFLHTSDQGDEIVGDLGTVAPAVIGEEDPDADVDVELRLGPN